MTFVISQLCETGKKDLCARAPRCVRVCQQYCIHPANWGMEAYAFDREPMLYIDASKCNGCTECVRVCPVEAIFPIESLPAKWNGYIERNSAYYLTDAASRADPPSSIEMPEETPQVVGRELLRCSECSSIVGDAHKFWCGVPHQWEAKQEQRGISNAKLPVSDTTSRERIISLGLNEYRPTKVELGTETNGLREIRCACGELSNSQRFCARCGASNTSDASSTTALTTRSDLPVVTITKALQRFRGTPDVHLSPSIPKDKLNNARTSCNTRDRIAVLVDCTVFGSSKNCVLFGCEGIYYHNVGRTWFMDYASFARRTVCVDSDNVTISLGGAQAISLSGSALPPASLLELLKSVQQAYIARQNAPDAPTGLDAVAGMTELKALLKDEIIGPLRDPERFKKYKVGIPNGLLFYGPPGCGKTFIAQQLAEDLGYAFLEVSPSTVGSPYMHESVLKIRELFETAADQAPSILFIDEFEGLVPPRSELGTGTPGKAEEINEILVQMSSCADRGVLLIAATNEPWKIDTAIQRTGRLDKKVYIGPPDEPARAQMLNYHLTNRPLAADLDVEFIAAKTQGYSASDLKVLVDEAAKLALSQADDIRTDYLLGAMNRVPPSISRALEEKFKSAIPSATLNAVSQSRFKADARTSYDDCLAELNKLVGLPRVKADVAKLASVVRLEQMRKTKGLKTNDSSLHIIFLGNPGTGKTTVARLIAEIYKVLGVVSHGHLVETDRAGLVAGFVGQTALKTKEVVEKSLGGVLFIDEAYSLNSGGGVGSPGHDFGREALDTLLKLMEDYRDKLIVIMAGYTDEMQRFIDLNPGMKSRFNKTLVFDDYVAQDLVQIFENFCRECDYIISDGAKAKSERLFQFHYENRDRTFGNARLARNIFEQTISNLAIRVTQLDDISDSALQTIEAEDIPDPIVC